MYRLSALFIPCFLVFMVQCLLNEPQDKVIEEDHKCMKKYKVTVDMLDKYAADELPYKEEFGKNALCLLTKLGVFNRFKQFKKRKFESKVKAERGRNSPEAKYIFENCEITNATAPATADAILTCLHRNRKPGERWW